MLEQWTAKHAPKSLGEMVLDEGVKATIAQWIESKDMPSMTLAGPPGIGKSTLAGILLKSLGITQYITQSCSIDGSIDMVKTRINGFCQMMSDSFKVVVLDEADCLTNAASNAGAQMALRNIISDSMKDTRFILTCNYPDRIIDALKSRCPVLQLKFSIEDVARRCIQILKQEGIGFDNSSLKQFIKLVVKPKFPDIRSIISHLEIMSASGKLVAQAVGEFDHEEILEFIKAEHDPIKIREYLLEHEDSFSCDYIMLARELFNYCAGDAKAMMLIAEGMYKMSMVLDKEIQFFAMLAALKGY